MSKEVLSVVITVYNQEKYVSDCIKSVINQTYDALDIIIVDDGSTDKSGIICDEYARKDCRISVVHKNNEGSVSSRKMGVQSATGKYITYIDGDDWVDECHFENIMNVIDDSDMVAFGLTCVYGDGSTSAMINKASSGVYDGERLVELKKNSLYGGGLGEFGLLPSMCAKVIRTELVRNNMMKVDNIIRMGDDGACTFPTICDCNKIVVDNSIMGYMYRKNIEGTLTSRYSYEEFARIEALYKVLTTEFEVRKADYMNEQLPYYMIFLFRIEFIYELAELSLSNAFKKIIHIKEARKLGWVKYVIANRDLVNTDKELYILTHSIDSVSKLFYSWYIKRKIFHEQ